MEQQNNNWRGEIPDPVETLKISDGEISIFVFKNEGVSRTHQDFGTSIVFDVIVAGETEPKRLYVKNTNYDLLGQIKSLGTLTGLKVELSRKGSSRSDTRYTIKKFEA